MLGNRVIPPYTLCQYELHGGYITHVLMNGFNKTEAAVFLVQAMLPEGFPFHQFELQKLYRIH